MSNQLGAAGMDPVVSEAILEELEIAMDLRSRSRCWGELRLVTIWQDGELKEWRIIDERINRPLKIVEKKKSG